MLTRYVQRNLTWVDLVSPTPAEVRSLMREYDLDPLIAEELLIPSFKPKVERRGEHIYVILHYPVLRGVHQRADQEIDFVIGKNLLITTRYASHDPLHAFAQAFEVDAVLDRHGTMQNGGHLFASMARNLYIALGNECDALHRKMQEIEERIFKGDERKMVIEISHVGRTIHDFRQVLLGHEEMLHSLEPASTRLFGQEFSFYVRSIEGEYKRVRTILEHLRDSVIEMRETNNSLLSTKQNEIMKTFTVLAFVFLPLTFISGLFGMNTEHNPIVGNGYDFWIIVGIMLLVSCICVMYFKRKGWLF